MNRITSEDFDERHLDLFNTGGAEANLITRREILDLTKRGHVKTFVIDGRILAIAGYVEMWEGVIEVFVIPSIYINVYPMEFHYATKRVLKNWEMFLGVHRMQTASVATARMDRWMRSLGFKCEGTLHKYTADKLDYRMWGRVR